MTITVVFNPPQPSDSPQVFNQKAFDTLADWNDWTVEANQLAADVNASEVAAGASATAAAGSAATATTKAAEALASKNAAAASETAAAGSASSASISASTATTKASEASASQSAAASSQSAAASSQSAASASQTAAASSASAASASQTAAAGSASAAATSAGTATTKAAEASASQAAAAASQGAAASSASAAAGSETAAAASASSAAGSATAANTAKVDAQAARDKAQQWAEAPLNTPVEAGQYSAKHWALQAQATVTGGLVYRGAHDASSGSYPATPSKGDYYKISVGGTMGGTVYAAGDSMIFNDVSWDKLDSTDQVTSVAGRMGDVVLVKGDVGLGNVDNTSDATKNAAVATLTNKTLTSPVINSPTGMVKGDVGLGNVDNTSDANKPISTATQTALNAKAPLTGGGTSGTWPISVSGSAGSSPILSTEGISNVNVNYGNSRVLRTDTGTGAAHTYAPILHMAAIDTMWQISVNHGTGNGTMAFRQGYSGSWGSWLTVLSSANYNSYAPTLTGGGASGTWGIHISGRGYPRRSDGSDLNFYWSGQSGQPTWLWGGTDGVNMYVYNPSNFSVNYANSAGSAGSCSGVSARATRANGNFYIDDNYGCSVVGAYSSVRYQGVYAMGDSYKLPADGTSTSGFYGIAWAHPNVGGIGGNLDSHGLIVVINGGFGSCMSYSIVASGNVTAYSDERLKKNWRPMPEDYVSRLAKVKVGIYDRIDAEASNKAAVEAAEKEAKDDRPVVPVVPIPVTQVGVGAQSFRELLPEAINEAKDEMGTLSVSYGNAALASCVELAKELVALRAELAELKLQLKGA